MPNYTRNEFKRSHLASPAVLAEMIPALQIRESVRVDLP